LEYGDVFDHLGWSTAKQGAFLAEKSARVDPD
jgi:hypothetical protein